MRVPVLLQLLCAGLSLFLVSSASAEDSSRKKISVTFWNIEWFPGRRPNPSPAEEERQTRSVHRDMAQLAPDLIGMEEVRDFDHAALAVQSLAGFKVDVCSNFPPREGQKEAQQIAIASKLQPISAWTEAWKPAGSTTPPRGFAFAAYQLSPARTLLVYAVHLKSNRGDPAEDIAMREEASRQLLEHTKAMAEAYGKLGPLTWIIGGDCNTSLDDPRFRAEKTLRNLQANGFAWASENLAPGDRITMPATQQFPPAAFDQIFYRGATVEKAWVTQTSRDSSDHRAINATFALAPSE